MPLYSISVTYYQYESNPLARKIVMSFNLSMFLTLAALLSVPLGLRLLWIETRYVWGHITYQERNEKAIDATSLVLGVLLGVVLTVWYLSDENNMMFALILKLHSL